MTDDVETIRTVKKTIVLDSTMDDFVRRTWALLIEDGLDATYSLALNFMLGVAILEGSKPGGVTPENREMVWDYVRDPETFRKLNLQDHLIHLREMWGKNP